MATATAADSDTKNGKTSINNNYGNNYPSMLDQAMLIKMMDGLFNGNGSGIYNIMLFMMVKPLEKLLNSIIEKTIKKIEETEYNTYYIYGIFIGKLLFYICTFSIAFYFNGFLSIIVAIYLMYKNRKEIDIDDKYEDKEEQIIVDTNEKKKVEFPFEYKNCFWESLIKKKCLQYEVNDNCNTIKQIDKTLFEVDRKSVV